MIVVLDIQNLQHDSFESLIAKHLPTAKHIYVVYGCQWLLLLEKLAPSPVHVYWMRAETEPKILRRYITR